MGDPMSEVSTTIFGALALELAPGAPARDALPQAQAGLLAAAIARDLADFDGAAAALELITVGAHYDPVELLRPGWPLHRELDQLAARAPGARDGGRIVAFGSHDAQLPGALAPSADHAGGPMRLVPWVLRGAAADIAAIAAHAERDLMERGMARADTALLAQDAFGLRIEHARHLTLHDLCAMTALQYDHAGLGPLWPVLETALLSPEREVWLDAAPEPLLHYADREAHLALFTPEAWHARYGAALGDDPDRLRRAFAHFEARQRQFAAVLMAHAVPMAFVHCGEKTVDEL